MLQFQTSWRFNSPGAIPLPVVHAFYSFIEKIAVQGEAKSIVEVFKFHFSGSSSWSSNLGWAWSDLNDCMHRAAENAPVFIEAFYKGCAQYQEAGLGVPDVDLINKVLSEHKSGYQIQLPYLIATEDFKLISVPQKTPSLAVQARTLIDNALNAADQFLAENKGRQAVSELLWSLETISTAFRNTESDEKSVQGKYFNKIIKDMKANSRDRPQEQILNWMMTLHGYLSSPTGGGVRHGTDLKNGIAIQPHEAQLYCNLIRSYLVFLIKEHEQANITDKFSGG